MSIIGKKWVTRSGNKATNHHIVGYNEKIDSFVTTEHLAETLNGLFGTHKLQFEGAPPILPIQLDEWITEKLSLENTVAIREQQPNLTIEDFYGKTFPQPTFRKSFAEFQNPITEASITYESGLRCTLQSQYPIIGTTTYKQRITLLPTANLSTIAKQSAQKTTFHHSLYLHSQIEKSFHEKELVSTQHNTLDEIFSEPIRNKWQRQTSSIPQTHFTVLPKDGTGHSKINNAR